MKKQHGGATALETETPAAEEPTKATAVEEPQESGFVYSPPDLKADLADRLRARHLPSGRDALKAGEIIKRREISFEVDGTQCEPDMFVNDAGDYITFRVTLRSLSSAQEIQALQGIKDGTAAPMMMARFAFYAINDAPLAPESRDFFWECLGTAGRQICLLAFHQLGAASEASMGKYLTSRSES